MVFHNKSISISISGVANNNDLIAGCSVQKFDLVSHMPLNILLVTHCGTKIHHRLMNIKI